jgi:hypothetical protein
MSGVRIPYHPPIPVFCPSLGVCDDRFEDQVTSGRQMLSGPGKTVSGAIRLPGLWNESIGSVVLSSGPDQGAPLSGLSCPHRFGHLGPRSPVFGQISGNSSISFRRVRPFGPAFRWAFLIGGQTQRSGFGWSGSARSLQTQVPFHEQL